jgi:hypothetical protein
VVKCFPVYHPVLILIVHKYVFILVFSADFPPFDDAKVAGASASMRISTSL